MGLTIRLMTLLVLAGGILEAQAGSWATPPEGLSAFEWADIRRQIEAPKYQVRESSTGYQAHNPAQGWKIKYQASGRHPHRPARCWGRAVSHRLETHCDRLRRKTR